MEKVARVLLLVLAFIGLDIFCRFLYSQTWFGTFTFNQALDPFDIIALVVTSVITIWLGRYISKKLTEERYQKEYIITDLKNIESEVEALQRDLLSASTVDIDRLLQHLNTLANSISKFKKTLAIFETKCNNTSDLERRFRALYINVTNLGGTQLVLTAVNKNQIDSQCNELIVSSRSIVREINTL